MGVCVNHNKFNLTNNSSRMKQKEYLPNKFVDEGQISSVQKLKNLHRMILRSRCNCITREKIFRARSGQLKMYLIC